VIPVEIAGGRCYAAGEAGKKGLSRGPGRSDTARGARALAERGSGAGKRVRLVNRGGRATREWASWAEQGRERAGWGKEAGPLQEGNRAAGREVGRGFGLLGWVLFLFPFSICYFNLTQTNQTI
jgi:hypothetical protein